MSVGTLLSPFLVSGSPIEGVVVRPLSRHRDDRGSFMEVFQQYWDGPIDPVQWSAVESEANVIRGPHVHLNHDEYFSTLVGRALVGLRDIRPCSPTRNKSCLIEVSAEAPVAVLFPKGLLHGWYFPERSIHIQAVSEAYRDYHSYDNLGCRWDDPDLAIPWPCTEPILSERASQFMSLTELLTALEPRWEADKL
jgi:dTDP-4-dehydrorhamnose 3,5-epimerase